MVPSADAGSFDQFRFQPKPHLDRRILRAQEKYKTLLLLRRKEWSGQVRDL
jgi:hypothetical protein